MNKNYWIVLVLGVAILIGLASILYKEEPKIERVDDSVTVTPPSPPSNILPYGKTTLHVGEIAQFKDISIELLRVFDESRCPLGVNCIWAGTLKGEVRATAGGVTKETVTIELGNSATIENITITLTSATPYPKEGQSITSMEYQLTFDVSQVTTSAPPLSTSPPSNSQGACYVGGCSSEICSDRPDMASTCIFRSEFACYKTATCERQKSGECGWTESSELHSCLNNPPAM